MRVSRILLWLLGIAGFGAAQDRVDKLFLEAPKETNNQEVERLSKIYRTRIETAGCNGVTVAPVKAEERTRIALTCPRGITKEMRDTLDTLASTPARKVEVVFDRELTADEMALCKPGEKEPEKAPKGTTWVRSGSTFILILNDQTIDVAGAMKWRPPENALIQGWPSDRYYFEFPVDLSKKIDKNPRLGRIRLLVDGALVNTAGLIHHPCEASKNKLRWTCAAAENKMLGIAINNPMSCALMLSDN